jgi:flagellar motility protein MotE (MotC chaperone)
MKMGNTYSDHFKKLKNQKKNVTMSKKTKTRLPIKAILFSCLGILGCLLALFFEEEQIGLNFPKLRISIFEKSLAEDKKVVTEGKAQNKAVSKEREIEEKHLLNLVERSRELDQREQNLLKLESEIEQKNKEISKQLNELRKIRDEIAEKLKARVDEDSKKIDQLVEVYSNMRPGQAARILEDLDEELAVQVLTKMKKKSAAEILNLMKVEKAKKFTELYTGFDRMPANNNL